MRRADREIKDVQRISEIIQSCDCCRLGLMEENGVYVVPLNFGYTCVHGEHAFYFHCAREGKKLTLIRRNPAVGFEMDCHHAVLPGASACDFAFRFRSVIGKGIAALVEEPTEKRKALECIMRHYSDREEWVFTDAQIEAVAVIRLDVTEIACKEHL